MPRKTGVLPALALLAANLFACGRAEQAPSPPPLSDDERVELESKIGGAVQGIRSLILKICKDARFSSFSAGDGINVTCPSYPGTQDRDIRALFDGLLRTEILFEKYDPVSGQTGEKVFDGWRSAVRIPDAEQPKSRYRELECVLQDKDGNLLPRDARRTLWKQEQDGTATGSTEANFFADTPKDERPLFTNCAALVDRIQVMLKKIPLGGISRWDSSAK